MIILVLSVLAIGMVVLAIQASNRQSREKLIEKMHLDHIRNWQGEALNAAWRIDEAFRELDKMRDFKGQNIAHGDGLEEVEAILEGLDNMKHAHDRLYDEASTETEKDIAKFIAYTHSSLRSAFARYPIQTKSHDSQS